jgi:hypothetical protein
MSTSVLNFHVRIRGKKADRLTHRWLTDLHGPEKGLFALEAIYSRLTSYRHLLGIAIHSSNDAVTEPS